MRRLLERVRAFFGKRRLDADLEGEVAAHLELATDEYIARGMKPDEARRAAMVRFGGVEPAKELHRDTRGLPSLDSILQDMRYAVRTLRRDAGFTVAALLILALGIGANTAVFSVVNTVLLRPLPFRDPGQLVWMENTAGREGLSSFTFRVGFLEAARARNHSFQDITGYFAFFAFGDYKLTGRGEPERLAGLPVAQNFFPLLGVQPMLGRLFTKEESQTNGPKAALLTHALWEQRFGADPKIVGQTLTLNSEAVTVVGVLPSTFDFGSVFLPGTRVDFFLPCVMDDIRNSGNTLSMVGRLKPGVSVAAAQTELTALMPELRRDYPGLRNVPDPRLSGLKDYVSGKLRRSLMVVWCAVGLILLIVCVNLANLLLARSATRAKEFAVRSALGAGRYRIVRQLLTESLILSSGGAMLGLMLAFALTRYLSTSRSIALPLLRDVRVDGTALGVTVLLAVGAAVIFGLAPSVRAAGGRIQDTLKEQGRGSSEGRGHGAIRASLVVSEVALACVLLSGAGLLLRSFLTLLDVDLGFQPERAIALRIDYRRSDAVPQRSAFFQDVLRRAEAVPGIEQAGISDSLPLGQNRNWGYRVDGKTYGPNDADNAFVYIVSPGYTSAMGMRMRAGRSFTWHDTETSEPVIMINEALARRSFPGVDAIGKRMHMDPTHERRVVGVVGDVRETRLEDQAAPAMFLPVSQNRDLAGAQLILRTRLPVDSIAPGVRAALRSVTADQAVADFRPLQQSVDKAVSPRRFFALLVGAFALLGLLLASLGIYAVISYSVARQTQEIGIRMALGASARELQMEVIGKTLRMALIGIAIGTAAALAAARLIASLLFNVSPVDPVTYAAMLGTLCAVSLIAGYIPARRASRVDPMTALRSE